MNFPLPLGHRHYHFCVYGDAEPYGKNGTRLWPKQVLVRQGVEIEDAWLILDGICITGVAVVGLIRQGRRLVWRNASYDPDPEPPGKWGTVSQKGGAARWRPVRLATAWERIAGVDGRREQTRSRQDTADHRAVSPVSRRRRP